MKSTKTIIMLALCCFFLPATAQKYVGGDISCLPLYEQAGSIYADHNGNVIASPLSFFKDAGMNAMRVRLFVNPTGYTTDALSPSERKADTNVYQDLNWVKALGKRIKEQGMKFLLDFHYSDTWADPGKQWTPDAWASLGDVELQKQLYDYTKAVLDTLKADGAEPDLIQTGNEISYGMLWGSNTTVGSSSTNRCYPSSRASYWDRFAGLLKQAIAACRAECSQAKIILHVERVSTSQQRDNANYVALTNFFQKMAGYGIDYDVIGLSYYPYFHGSLNELEGAIQAMEAHHPDKQIMIVETGYPYAWAVEGSTYDYTDTYPYSDEGQKAFTNNLIAMLNKHEKVTGLFWWWMEYNAYPFASTKLSGWYNASLYDSNTGRATSALSALKDFLNTSSGISQHSMASLSQDDDAWYTLSGAKVGKPSTRGIYIHHGKKTVKKD